MIRVRHAAWLVGAPARLILIAAIRAYRVTLSGWLGGQCRFAPTCSHYTEDAIRARGAVAGSILGAWRILRCNPFGAGGIDRAPQPLPWRRSITSYDAVIPMRVDEVVR